MRTFEALLVDLAEIVDEVRDRFPDARARLDQLTDHAATVAMVIEHIYTEAERELAA